MDKPDIEEICSKMCDQYCRYPRELHDDDLLMAVCVKCPMNKLKNGDDGRLDFE